MNGCGVIQGDGINIKTLGEISAAVKKAGYSAQCVAYGMGGGLLQKVNRDTMSFATKLSKIFGANGVDRLINLTRDVMKMPKSDPSKFSLPGEFQVIRNEEGKPIVYPAEIDVEGHNELELVYDYGKVCQWEDFDSVRKRVRNQFNNLPKICDPISPQLREKINRVINAHQQVNAPDY